MIKFSNLFYSVPRYIVFYVGFAADEFITVKSVTVLLRRITLFLFFIEISYYYTFFLFYFFQITPEGEKCLKIATEKAGGIFTVRTFDNSVFSSYFYFRFLLYLLSDKPPPVYMYA